MKRRQTRRLRGGKRRETGSTNHRPKDRRGLASSGDQCRWGSTRAALEAWLWKATSASQPKLTPHRLSRSTLEQTARGHGRTPCDTSCQVHQFSASRGPDRRSRSQVPRTSAGPAWCGACPPLPGRRLKCLVHGAHQAAMERGGRLGLQVSTCVVWGQDKRFLCSNMSPYLCLRLCLRVHDALAG